MITGHPKIESELRASSKTKLARIFVVTALALVVFSGINYVNIIRLEHSTQIVPGEIKILESRTIRKRLSFIYDLEVSAHLEGGHKMYTLAIDENIFSPHNPSGQNPTIHVKIPQFDRCYVNLPIQRAAYGKFLAAATVLLAATLGFFTWTMKRSIDRGELSGS